MDDDRGAPARTVPEALTELFALAESLRELPLEGVEPVMGLPRWE